LTTSLRTFRSAFEKSGLTTVTSCRSSSLAS
jgi:hypothetical protein